MRLFCFIFKILDPLIFKFFKSLNLRYFLEFKSYIFLKIIKPFEIVATLKRSLNPAKLTYTIGFLKHSATFDIPVSEQTKNEQF